MQGKPKDTRQNGSHQDAASGQSQRGMSPSTKNHASAVGMSRRAFLGGLGVSVAVTTAGLAGCAQPRSVDSPVSSNNSPTDAGKPAFLTPPAPPTDIAEVLECDVLVIGLGLAGIAAARQAAEDGVAVIGIDKQEGPSWVSMAGDFGVVGSQIQKNLGINWAPRADIVNQLQKDMTYRPTPSLLNYWYDHSGADFDWLVEGAQFEVLPSTAANRSTELPNYIRPKCFPPLAGYDWRSEYYPYFHGTITTNPNMDWACQNALDIAERAGARFFYGTWGEQLITEATGAVTGAYVRDKESA